MNPYRGKVKSSVYAGGLANPDHVRQSLELFADLSHPVHLTSAPSFRQELIQGDLDDLVKTAESLSDGTGCYFGLNPVMLAPWTKEKIKDENILCRRWLFVDADPVRPQPVMNSSEEEHEAARLLVYSIMDVMGTEAGWPQPIVCDSGNGWHLFWSIDLPNDEDSKSIIRDVLRALASRFDTPQVQIDRKCHDARRIAKLPGTWTRKGPHSNERPHRPSRLVYVPDSLEVLSRESMLLVASAAPQKGRPPAARKTVFQGLVHDSKDRSYALAALEREAAKCAAASAGGLNNQLFESGAACGNFVPDLLTHAEVFESLLSAIRRAGANNEKKDEDTLRRAIEKGMETPRKAPDSGPSKNGLASSKASASSAKQEKKEGDGPVTIQACDVKTRSVEWLWPGRIPVGKLTVIAGMPGLGKTFFLCDLVARVTSGCPWPDARANSEKGSVLFISGEDEPEDTLVPRLQEAGADLTRVRFFVPKALGEFTLGSTELLTKAIEESGDDVRLVAIDPPTSFTGSADDHKNSELRRILTPLAGWAAEHRCAVVFVTHLNKGAAVKVDAAYRVSGSIAWVAAARACYLMSKDSEDPDRRVFAVVKNNLAPEPPTLAYRLTHGAEDGRGRMEWLGVVEVTADQAVNGNSGGPSKKDAERFLIEAFRLQREWPSDELFRDAKEEHIGRNKIFRAKEALGIPKARKCVRQNGEVYWVWYVPDDWPHLQDGVPEKKAEDDEAAF